jgi:hypothetical protein
MLRSSPLVFAWVIRVHHHAPDSVGVPGQDCAQPHEAGDWFSVVNLMPQPLLVVQKVWHKVLACLRQAGL